MSEFYNNKKVAVTGAAGFIAFHLMERLIELGADVRGVDIIENPDYFPHDAEYLTANLMTYEGGFRAFKGVDYVFHLAAIGWGFHENLKKQPQILTKNLQLNTVTLDAAYKSGVTGYLLTSSAAVYPGYLEMMQEDAPWDQPPHGSEKYYAWSKRMAEIQAKAYFDHYDLPIAVVRLFNPYGPGDNFDPDKSHVIPALIRRAVEGENPFTVWGTGKPLRSFIHVDDVVKGMTLALEKLPTCEPVNLGSAETTSISELVEMIIGLTGKEDIKIEFDRSKPDGHPRRLPDITRAVEKLGMTEFISLKDGLRDTINWFINNYK